MIFCFFFFYDIAYTPLLFGYAPPVMYTYSSTKLTVVLQVHGRDTALLYQSQGSYSRDDHHLWFVDRSGFCQPYCSREYWMG